MNINSIVIPYRGRFKGLQCQVVAFGGAGLVKIAHGKRCDLGVGYRLEILSY